MWSFFFLVASFSGVKVEASSNFSDNNWQISWLIKNADFEVVDIADFGVSAGAPYVWYVDQEGVEAWGTSNPSGEIEVWQNGVGQPIPAYSGNNFIELNSNGPGPVYQDIKTIPGSTLTWSFAHRGRSGIDTAELLIGAPGNLAPIFLASDGQEWGTYSGTYVVPAGQTHTRLTFAPISTSNGNLTTGNFLDDINLYISIEGAQLGDYVWHDENGNGVQDNGESPAPGVEVNLYDNQGSLLQTQTTNDLGGYLFSGLLPGNYGIAFVNPDPSHYVFTNQKSGGDAARDSDPNKNGRATINIPTLRSEVISMDAGLTTIGSAMIHKTDGVKNLAGASFDVLDSNGNLITNVTTDANGIAMAENLIPGTYTTKETSAPIGYQLDQTATSFEIVYEQTTPVELNVTNQIITGSVTVHKIGKQDQALPYAIFEINTASGENIGTITTDKNGDATMSGLIPGDYVLSEVTAPKGYERSKETRPFTIPFNPTETVELTVKNELIETPPEPKPDEPSNPSTPTTDSKHSAVITATKAVTSAEKLPATGDSDDLAVLFIGIFALTTSMYLVRRK
ncbi:LPXTG cell wall anchor domain-containing protein [Listeria cornellensis]|uniref:Putative peptidoglycan bound protein (LPXTG motif) n=1 Tax=Listeria cornellensis FSL F6-0969 TaxID=1265820 RepID=W7C329_9LIST|nr:LPXTG cell wall anchor domain-containing protein [Listeria cornellensis]EUJ31635.1 putative peptidoglycan bound protein (LPXTG motif) [Listeria cornellensis FSL F6-0969]